MTKRIFRSIFLVALTVLLAALTLIMGAIHTYFTQVQTNQLAMETTLAAHALENQGVSYFEGLAAEEQCRITWIDADGTVLYDNRLDAEGLPSHLERQEVADALKFGQGQSVRYSDTLMERYVYTAKLLPDGTVLRLATSQDSVLSLVLGMSQYVVLILLITVLITYLLSRRLSRDVVRPINELNLDDPLSNEEYEEITPLLQRLDSQQAQLRGQQVELKQKQKEFNTVTRSLSEGLVLLNAGGTILSINPSAARILAVTQNCLGADFSVANRNSDIAALVETALGGEKAEKTLDLAEGSYLAAASPVRSEGKVFGVVLLLFDVTQKHQAEQLRREFTSNVSHELKTPLQAILGYSELMKSGMVPPADMGGFSEKIYTEARRLLTLVEDTLRLSRLESGDPEMQQTSLDLLETARQTVRELQGPAELGEIRLELEGSSAPITGIPQLVSAIVFNLTENAVKYSHPGGRVLVRIEDSPNAALLIVSDQGAGIPMADQERVFERFFRGDKSHSKAVGGTGLGLSIVKHAASILGAEVQLESAVDVGTTVTVRFPK